jgi:hypothetical protein
MSFEMKLLIEKEKKATHLVSPEVDGASAHHLRELGNHDGHGDEARDPIVHSLEGVIRVHERVNGKVHHDEPTRWSSVLFESVPNLNE